MKDLSLVQEYMICAVNEKGGISGFSTEKLVCLVAAGLLDLRLSDCLTIEKKKVRTTAPLPEDRAYLGSLYEFVGDKPKALEKIVEAYTYSVTDKRLVRLMEDVGRSPDRILAETKSTSTEENFAFSRQILMDQGLPEDMSIVYVTNAFHCYRAGEYARRAGFVDPHALPAGISILSVLPCYLREVLAVLYYWVFKSSESGLMHSMVGILSLNKKFFYKS